MGILRSVLSPPAPSVDVAEGKLPGWFVDEYKKKSVFKAYASAVLKVHGWACARTVGTACVLG